MKKNRYSKPVKKEVPSRRKLAREVALLEVEVNAIGAQMDREKTELRGDLLEVRQERSLWQGRAASLRAENDRLCKTMEEMTQVDEFVTVGSWITSRDEVMRSLYVPPGQVSVGVNIGWRPWERRDLGAVANEAYLRAVVDGICRRVKDELGKQMRLLGRG